MTIRILLLVIFALSAVVTGFCIAANDVLGGTLSAIICIASCITERKYNAERLKWIASQSGNPVLGFLLKQRSRRQSPAGYE